MWAPLFSDDAAVLGAVADAVPTMCLAAFAYGLNTVLSGGCQHAIGFA